jgi:GNAT superfamily N-acetyltransferase
VTQDRKVELLSADHIEGLRLLSMEPDVAGVAGIDVAIPLDAAAEFIGIATKAREDGRSYVFVLVEDGEVSGVCRLIGVLGVPRLIVGVRHAYRGRGNGAFLVRHVLEYAFETLGLELVTATGPCLRLVSQYGRLDGNGLSRSEWMAARGKTVP